MEETNGQANREELDQLLRDLAEGDETTRKYAAEDLGYGGYLEAIPNLIQGLVDPSISVAETCVSALVRLGTSQVAEMVAQCLSSEDVRLRNYAVEILSLLGTTAIEVLETQLQSEDRDVRKFSVDILLEIGSDRSLEPLIIALDDTDINIAATAADGIGKVGREEHLAVLRKYLDSEVWMKCAVIRGMGCIGGPEAVEAILPSLRDEDMMVKISAIQSLGYICNISALSGLLYLLGDESLSLFGGETINAIFGIMQAYPDENYGEIINEALLVPILSLAEKAESQIRLQAIEILLYFGFESVVGRLVNLTADPKTTIVEAAVRSIIAIDPSDITPFQEILSESSTASITQKAASLRILGGLSSQKGQGLLIDFLDPAGEELTCTALQALPTGFSPLPLEKLKALFQSEVSKVREYAAETMGRLGAEDFCECLIAQLGDEDPDVQEQVDNALIEIGTANENSLIRPYLDAISPMERKMAFQYYGSHHPERISEKFINGLQDVNEDIRIIAIKVLGNLSLLTFKMIHDALKDTDENVCIQAARSLGTFPRSQSLVEQITQVLTQSDDERIKVELLQILSELGDLDVINSVLPLLEDESTWVQIEAVEALKILGDVSVVPILKKLLDSDNDELVETIENAIEELEY
ncbi:MAG: hypothetical protein COB67_01635 [SAR324 cluster bacterium]|uniref:HEAT repeat domain-containing protein n=1 Tax=SAR324 cluster bacterium TaxID=2024889 RepID=A0A2A4TA68_9DELT|nr:MAG: hypothetical protein COB67_01635 [SAR324 cluster bacterium]